MSRYVPVGVDDQLGLLLVCLDCRLPARARRHDDRPEFVVVVDPVGHERYHALGCPPPGPDARLTTTLDGRPDVL